ncbi:MAG: hypothetical protein E3J64_03570 [Anaerolineales bacterium]|nr:MAG: hypothetical protein E3J64_03570 [Anaerolineales bacterium]
MKRRNACIRISLGVLLMSLLLSSCDSGGVPIRLRIDEFTMDLDVDEMLAGALDKFKDMGLLNANTRYLPELWPESLPSVQYRVLLAAPPIPVDLTPDPDSEEAEKYKDISKAEGVVTRIELNRLVLRIESSSITVALPEMRLQVADDKDAEPEDRLAWRTIGWIPGAEPGSVGDMEFEFLPGGESYLNSQLRDEDKEFSIRVLSKLEIDTDENPRLPAGKALVRLIVVATFFIDPAGAIEAAQ